MCSKFNQAIVDSVMTKCMPHRFFFVERATNICTSKRNSILLIESIKVLIWGEEEEEGEELLKKNNENNNVIIYPVVVLAHY